MIEGWGLAAAGIAAAGAVGGAVISSNASKSAANSQAGAAADAAQTQRDLFNAQSAYAAPQRNLGYGADSLLAQLYGIPDPNAAGVNSQYGANAAGASFTGGSGGGAGGTSGAPGTAGPGTPNYNAFYNSPGYQFSLSQGQNAINRSASANGSLYSSNTLSALGAYTAGAAGTQYNNYVQQLMGLAGLGGSAVAGTNAAAQNAGNNISSTQLSAGNANASGVLGSAGAWTGALQQGGNLLGNYLNKNNSPPPPTYSITGGNSDPYSPYQGP